MGTRTNARPLCPLYLSLSICLALYFTPRLSFSHSLFLSVTLSLPLSLYLSLSVPLSLSFCLCSSPQPFTLFRGMLCSASSKLSSLAVECRFEGGDGGTVGCPVGWGCLGARHSKEMNKCFVPHRPLKQRGPVGAAAGREIDEAPVVIFHRQLKGEGYSGRQMLPLKY